MRLWGPRFKRLRGRKHVVKCACGSKASVPAQKPPACGACRRHPARLAA